MGATRWAPRVIPPPLQPLSEELGGPGGEVSREHQQLAALTMYGQDDDPAGLVDLHRTQGNVARAPTRRGARKGWGEKNDFGGKAGRARHPHPVDAVAWGGAQPLGPSPSNGRGVGGGGGDSDSQIRGGGTTANGRNRRVFEAHDILDRVRAPANLARRAWPNQRLGGARGDGGVPCVRSTRRRQNCAELVP